jgi:hypothetical protein
MVDAIAEVTSKRCFSRFFAGDSTGEGRVIGMRGSSSFVRLRLARNPEDSKTPNSRAVPAKAATTLMNGLTDFLVGCLTPQCGQDWAAVLAIFPHFLHRASAIGFIPFLIYSICSLQRFPVLS